MKKTLCLKHILLLSGIFAVLSDAKALDYTWIGSGSTSWSTSDNWSPTGPPTVSGTTNNVVVAALASGGVMALDYTGTATVANWENSGIDFNIRPTSTGDRTLNITGTLTKNTSSTALTFRSNGATQTLSMNIGSLAVNGGSLALGLGAGGTELVSLNVGDTSLISQLNVRADAAQFGVVNLNAATARLAIFTGGANSSGGASVRSVNGTAGSVEVTSVAAANLAGTLTIDGTDSGVFSGTLLNGASGATLSVVKTNSGTQTFGGNGNSYSGGTHINAGTLLVANIASSSATGTGEVVIQSGGVLGGTGFIGGAVTTLSAGSTSELNGHLAPGIGAAGTLTINNTLSLGDHTFLDYELNAPNLAGGTGGNDLLRVLGTTGVNGDLSLGKNVTLNLTSLGMNFGPGTYDLIEYTGALTGADNLSSWTVVGLSQPYSFDFDADSVFLTVAAVPEPRTAMFLIGGAIFALLLRRKAIFRGQATRYPQILSFRSK